MERKKERVLLLLQRPEAWLNIASVWAALRAHPGFEPYVLVLPSDVRDLRASAVMMARSAEMLRSLDVPFEEWTPGKCPQEGAFAAAILNHPYDRYRPDAYKFGSLSRVIPTTIYIPYGLSMGGGRRNFRFQFSQPVQLGATAVIARSPWEKRLYAEHCPVGDSHVQVLGHPRFDCIVRQLEMDIPADMSSAIGGRLAVLWNSHFSFTPTYSQSLNFSTFDLVGPELFEFTRIHRTRMCLLWRPHPILFPVMVSEGLMSNDELSELRSELPKVGVVLDERPSHIPAFRASDGIMTDVGSFLLEYLITGKPICALRNPEGEPLNEEANALVEHYATASEPRGVLDYIMKLGSAPEELPDRTGALREHLPMLDGQVGARVVGLLQQLVMGAQANKLPRGFQESTIERHGDWRLAPHEKICWEDSCDVSDVETPVLDKVIAELRELRARKLQESKWRKNVRRLVRAAQTSTLEALRRHPTAMRVARSLRPRASRR